MILVKFSLTMDAIKSNILLGLLILSCIINTFCSNEHEKNDKTEENIKSLPTLDSNFIIKKYLIISGFESDIDFYCNDFFKNWDDTLFSKNYTLPFFGNTNFIDFNNYKGQSVYECIKTTYDKYEVLLPQIITNYYEDFEKLASISLLIKNTDSTMVEFLICINSESQFNIYKFSNFHQAELTEQDKIRMLHQKLDKIKDYSLQQRQYNYMHDFLLNDKMN